MSQVLDAIAKWADSKPEAMAICGADEGFTYASLQAELMWVTTQIAMETSGVTAPVAMLLDNSPAWAIIDLALIALGRTSLPIPSFFTPEQISHALKDAGAGFLITLGGDRAKLQVGRRVLNLSRLAHTPVSLPEGTAKITYTSGSTGQPKGVCLSQTQLEGVATALVEAIGSDFADRHLPLLPLAILLENVAGLYPTLLAGGCYDILPPAETGLAEAFRPDLAKLVATIVAERATSLILVPELLRALVMAMIFTGTRFPDLELVAVGGAKVAPQLLAQARGLGLPVYEGYGLSECASVVALNTPHAAKTGSVGKVLNHLKVEIAKDGEILVGPSPFLGYAGGPKRSGVVATGDLGRLDDEGFLFIDGRKSNLIITGFGRNISPEWVESELLAQPEIRQAVVYGEAQAELSALLVPLSPELEDSALQGAVDRANLNLPAYAQIRNWRRRGPLDAAAGELTGNGRPRRKAILATLTHDETPTT